MAERVNGNEGKEEKESACRGGGWGENRYESHFPDSCIHFGSKTHSPRAMLDLCNICVVYLWFLCEAASHQSGISFLFNHMPVPCPFIFEPIKMN